MKKIGVSRIKVTSLVLDWSLYPRTSVSLSAVTKMIDAVGVGAVLPPIVVEAETGRIVDGFHRLQVAQRLGQTDVEAEEWEYEDDGELYADAVRRNRSHGRPLGSYDIKKAVAKLIKLGWARDKISDVVQASPARVDQIIMGFGRDDRGESVPLKAGLEHIQPRVLSQQQVNTVKGHGGMHATWYAKQIRELLDNELEPTTPGFLAAMDALMEAWADTRDRVAEEVESRAKTREGQPWRG